MACVLQAVCRPLDMAALAQWMVIVHVLVGILAAVAHESLPLLVRRTAASLPSQKRCASRNSLTFRGDGLFSLNVSQNAKWSGPGDSKFLERRNYFLLE